MPQSFSPRLHHAAAGPAPRCARLFAAATLALLAILTTAPTAAAQGLTLTTVSYNIPGTFNASDFYETQWGGQDVRVEFSPYALPVTLAEDWDVSTSNAKNGEASVLASVFAEADYGSLHVGLTVGLTAKTNASTGAPNDVRSASARIGNGRVQARWQDTALNDSSGDNRVTVFIGLLILDGNMNVGLTKPEVPAGTSNVFLTGSEAALFLRLTSSNFLPPPYPNGHFGSILDATAPGFVSIHNLPPTLIPVTMVMRDGVPFVIDYTLELLCTAHSSLSTNSKSPLITAAYIDANFKQSLRWGGIISATDSVTGLPVTDYNLTSASGFDYRYPAPIPEPASLALLVLAAPMLLLRSRA